MQILIVGASGYLGSHVYKYFKENYDNVVGTYHTHQTDSSMVHFNINEDEVSLIDKIKEAEEKCAIICAAEAKYDACKINTEESFKTNVVSTIKLIDKLKQMNYYIIFCSTEAVYDGTKGNYIESDLAHPVNEYGKMKLQVEQYITAHYPNDCIFRLSKMIGDISSPRDTLCEWKKKALERKDIYCIRGNYFSPVDVEDVVKCIELAFQKQIKGIYNICGNTIYHRSDLCKEFLRFLGLSTNIYNKEVEEFGFKAVRPMNVGMSNLKIREHLNYEFKNMQEVYMRYNS